MYQKTLPYIKGIKYFIILFLSFFSFHSSFSQNAIVTENLLAGTPPAIWDIPTKDAGDSSIQGFATDISVNVGGTINFKINVGAAADMTYSISIYRIGYYQGNGARLIADLGPGFAFTGITQAGCAYDVTTGLTDCGNWTTAASWSFLELQFPDCILLNLHVQLQEGEEPVTFLLWSVMMLPQIPLHFSLRLQMPPGRLIIIMEATVYM